MLKRNGLFKMKSTDTVDSKSTYTNKISIPQYLPSDKKPAFEEMYDVTKYHELLQNINKSDLSNEEKQFLRFAATRHIVFNYAKIADYYAHSDKKIQKLMEQSALVIIDPNDAIANGYMRLSKNIKSMLEESL